MSDQLPYSASDSAIQTQEEEVGHEGRVDVPRLSMHGIVKRFPGVLANDQINFEVRKGEIHALLGENGAGKTTLMNVLYGLHQPDAGEIYLDGKRVDIRSPREALALRIGMIHQHFALVPTLSVAENVLLGMEGSSPFLNRKRLYRQVAEIANRYGLTIDPRAKVWELSVGKQQRVEILKALYRQASLLIMDEPTAVLTPQETESLFYTLQALVESGLTIILITHKLDEVMCSTDRVTVLRRGKKVATVDTPNTDKSQLAYMMVGQEVLFTVSKTAPHLGDEILRVEDLEVLTDRGIPALKGIDISLQRGEILGIAGVSGNGQDELAQVLAGLRRPRRGKIYLANRDVTNASPRRLIELGVGYIPADRLAVGIAATRTLEENCVVKQYRSQEFGRVFLSWRKIRAFAKQLIAEFGIIAPSPAVLAQQLSGGNLQRLLLARELSRDLNLLIADQPTRGLDVGGIEYVRRRLIDARDNGTGILLISEDLYEILALADRVAVLYEGRLSFPSEHSREAIGLAMGGETG